MIVAITYGFHETGADICHRWRTDDDADHIVCKCADTIFKTKNQGGRWVVGCKTINSDSKQAQGLN